MKTSIKTFSLLLIAGASLIYQSYAQDGVNRTANADSMNNNKALMANKGDMPDLTGWPERPTLAVKEMMAKYGAPVEVSSEAIIWHDAGPFKRIMVTKKEVPHDFPMPHMDFYSSDSEWNVNP